MNAILDQVLGLALKCFYSTTKQLNIFKTLRIFERFKSEIGTKITKSLKTYSAKYIYVCRVGKTTSIQIKKRRK